MFYQQWVWTYFWSTRSVADHCPARRCPREGTGWRGDDDYALYWYRWVQSPRRHPRTKHCHLLWDLVFRPHRSTMSVMSSSQCIHMIAVLYTDLLWTVFSMLHYFFHFLSVSIWTRFCCVLRSRLFWMLRIQRLDTWGLHKLHVDSTCLVLFLILNNSEIQTFFKRLPQNVIMECILNSRVT